MSSKISRPRSKQIDLWLDLKIPPAFRGNCDCGCWIVISISVPSTDPLYCDCGRSYYYNPDDEHFHRNEHPIIFLDVDGVLINLESRTYAHPDCIRNLNSITDATNAVVVVSSTWRKGGVSTIADILSEWGVTGKVVSVTPDLSRTERGIWIARERGQEIWAWLRDKRRNQCKFVILDDETDMGGLRHSLIHTRYETGLTENDAKMAIEMLNRE